MVASNPPGRASSPCIQVCILDPVTGLCEGCGRTLDEIGRWARMSEAERRAVMDALEERRRRTLAASAEAR